MAIDYVYQAEEDISTGDIVMLTATTYSRGIKKATSGATNVVGISQIAITSGQAGMIRVFGEGVVNVGVNYIEVGDLIMPSEDPGIGVVALSTVDPACGMALETGTGLIKVLIFRS